VVAMMVFPLRLVSRVALGAVVRIYPQIPPQLLRFC